VCVLVGYFGEARAEPCGHCSYCLTGRAQLLPKREPKPPIPSSVDGDALAALRRDHPDALGTPRQQARFLAGITSPATSRAKLSRDRHFGSLTDRRFADVLAWWRRQPSRGILRRVGLVRPAPSVGQTRAAARVAGDSRGRLHCTVLCRKASPTGTSRVRVPDGLAKDQPSKQRHRCQSLGKLRRRGTYARFGLARAES
jgi:hypothetical protein